MMRTGNDGPISSERVKLLHNTMMALSYHHDSHDAPRSLLNLVNFEPPMNRGATDDYREITIHFSERSPSARRRVKSLIAFDTVMSIHANVKRIIVLRSL